MVTSTANDSTTATVQASELASLQNRFFAALIDGVIMCVCTTPVLYLLVMMGLPMGFLSAIVGTIIAAAVFLGINYRLLETNGQTIGKKVMNLQIVGRDDRMMPVQDLLIRRYLPVFAVTAIPILGGLIALANVLLIFRDSRACGHDDIAQTRVIQL